MQKKEAFDRLITDERESRPSHQTYNRVPMESTAAAGMELLYSESFLYGAIGRVHAYRVLVVMYYFIRCYQVHAYPHDYV